MHTPIDSPLPHPWGSPAYWIASPTTKPEVPSFRDPPGDPPQSIAGDRSRWITASSLEDPDVLLRGVLSIHHRGPERRRPYLMVTAYCPVCRHDHFFPWDDEFPLSAIIPVELPCRDREIASRDGYLGLEDDRHEDNQRVMIEFRRLLARYKARKRMYGYFAMNRAGDPSNAASLGQA